MLSEGEVCDFNLQFSFDMYLLNSSSNSNDAGIQNSKDKRFNSDRIISSN